ncbi:MAG: Stk1 family PASTA domain-containing Ser/Thr kinase [Acidimicrobiia bacterium]
MSDAEPKIYNGRYELHRLIARGGMADVFLAHDQLLDRPVAVKVLFPQFAGDPASVERFRREAQAAAGLTHPSIVGVYDWGEEGGTYYIVMEYIDGRSLAEILRSEGMLHPNRAADIAIDVAGALSFAHRNGVVHRDIKPGNILITSSGQVKVTDFGIARALDQSSSESSLTQVGSVMGTATYFSPEQAQGQRVDPRSDLYSLGIVLYEMLASRPPFSGDSAVSIAFKQVQEAPPPPSSINPRIPASIEAITMRLLQKDPANRYADAEELRGDLRRFREGVPVGGATAAVPTTQPAATTAMPVVPAQARTAYATNYAPEPDYADEDEPPSRTGWFIAGLVVLIAALLALLFMFAEALGLRGGEDVEQVEVPTVLDQDEATAIAILRDKGFEERVEREVNSEAPIGTVFRQDPAGGATADKGSEVTIWVSVEDGEAFSMPNMVGFRETDVIAQLTSRGLVLAEGGITRRNDDQAPAGEVLEQTPPAGETVRAGDTFTLVISDGPEEVDVVDVRGRSLAEARSTLTDAGFQVTDEEEASTSVPEGQVTRTDPIAGTPLAKGSRVVIFVSTGPPPPETVTVPNVVNQTQATAESQLISRGLSPQVSFDTHPSVPAGNVISQDPDAGTTVDKDSTVKLVVSQGPGSTSSTTSTTEDSE